MDITSQPQIEPPVLEPAPDSPDMLELAELFDEAWLDYEDQPLLIVDTELERVLARQQEMMAFAFEGIGEERKPEKRMGLGLQQLDIEQRHALRLLLLFRDAATLTAHLERCLADPAYGYGERGDQGRTVAQAMAAVSDGDLTGVVTEWLAAHRDFQRAVLSGVPFNFLSLYHYADVDSFMPLLQRVGDDVWRLGVEDQGQYRDFTGTLETTWPQICDVMVGWLEADNEAWLTALKQKATRRPDSILRAARADRLYKKNGRLEVTGRQIRLVSEPDGQNWPRTLVLSDAAGVGQLALSRLSGHNFFELSWAGGVHVRYFEIGGTTRQKVPFQHIELATLLAETLGAEYGLTPEPVTADTVEAAYLRRMKATGAVIDHGSGAVPKTIQGRPVAVYMVGEVQVMLLQGGADFAYVTVTTSQGEAVLIRRDERQAALVALPVKRGRPRRGQVLMSTPLAELELSQPGWARAVSAWGAWLAWALYVK